MRVLLILSLVAAASASIGSIQLQCPTDEWVLYRSPFEVTCLRLMQTPKMFDEAYRECFSMKAHMVSFAHRREKIEFVNNMILEQVGDNSTSLWFLDRFGVHEKMVERMPAADEWLVFQPSNDTRKIKLMGNSAKVPREFICEALAQPVPQRPKFSRQPEDLQISQDVIDQFQEAEEPKEGTEQLLHRRPRAEQRPLIATFNCHAFALPKPTIEWRSFYLNKTETEESLVTEEIKAKLVYDPREPLKDLEDVKEPRFYDLRRNCREHRCNAAAVQERSQLILVGAQLADPKLRIACVAKNDFGTVVSREAEIVITSMEQFSKKQETYTVKAGRNVTLSCDLDTTPDAASVEWLRLMPKGSPVPVEEINRRSRGSVQFSKATFDLIIDMALAIDAGDYVCRVRMHSGRIGHVNRDRTVSLEVEPCGDDCDLKEKPVQVQEGYPAVLSMNPWSNEIVRFNDDFLLECPCLGKRDIGEELTVQWNMTRKDAQMMPMLPRGSSLLMRNADESHSGTYACRCVRGEEKSDWSETEVRVLPLIAPMNHTELVEATVGASANFTTQMPPFDIEGISVHVTPMFNYRSLTDMLEEKDDQRIQLDANNGRYIIAIKDIKESDAGAYGIRISIDYFGKWTEVDYYYSTLTVSK